VQKNHFLPLTLEYAPNDILNGRVRLFGVQSSQQHPFSFIEEHISDQSFIGVAVLRQVPQQNTANYLAVVDEIVLQVTGQQLAGNGGYFLHDLYEVLAHLLVGLSVLDEGVALVDDLVEDDSDFGRFVVVHEEG
jgi:hypothetical protein